MIGNRRKAREAALQVLYQDEFHTPKTRMAAERHYWEDSELAPPGDDVRAFATFLVDGVRTRRKELDKRISTVAHNWKLDRMSRVDRNILRSASFELLYAKEIPSKVTLNEAIEVAKAYGTEDSGAFINGILDRISRSLGGEPEAGDETAEGALAELPEDLLGMYEPAQEEPAGP